MRAWLSCLFVALTLVACGGSDEPATPVAFQDVVERYNGAYAVGPMVFRTQAELAAAWAPTRVPGAGPLQLPAFDFGRNMLVGMSMGDGLRCYIPSVVAVELRGEVMTVQWKSAGPDGPTTLACVRTWPLNALVSVPQHAGPVEFVRVASS